MPPKFFARLSQALQKNKAASSESSQPTFGIGTMINDRYRLEAEIGRGGMGIVYRAYDLSAQRDVALKVINLDTANALTRQQFAREAQITAQLTHPHIVATYETGTVDTGGREPWPYIVMELVTGTSLDNLQGFTFARIIDLGQQICDALAYAHAQGLVHRDLKPGNILIEKRGFQYFAKLMDFGLARPRDAANLPRESNLAGTIFYLAPEVIAGQPADVSADLYALGVILYEMITGRVPFSDFIDDQAILAQHLEESVAPPSHSRADVPPALDALVLRLLAKDPAERFASAQEVHAALAQITLTPATNTPRGNLPSTMNFTGSADEIAHVTQMLAAHPLVTLIGADNILARAAGAQLADEFSDGVWVVDLADLHDPAEVLPTVAEVFGVGADPARPLTVALIETLREKNLLLILERCDQLLGACAQLAETILHTCPEVRLLVISQHPLNIPAEQCYYFSSKESR